jgi:hypothetical protein
MKRLLPFLLFILPQCAFAQEVTDTVFFTVQGDLAEVQIVETVITLPVVIGDTIPLVAEAFDSEGDPVSFVATWATSDTTALRIIQNQDGTTGAIGIVLRKGSFWVAVRAERITEIRLATFRNGVLNWSGRDTASVGGEIQYCAYVLNGYQELVAESPGPPACPTVFYPRAVVPNTVYAFVPQRIIPPEFIFRRG